MIGNDIVDLEVALRESDWRRPRYLAKIFTAAERAFIDQSKDQDLAVWTLWSRKEAVYKIVARLENRSFYAPKRIASMDLLSSHPKDAMEKGKLVYGENIFTTQSFFTPQYIHTIAQLAGAEDSGQISQSFFLPTPTPTQSTLIKEKLLTSYADQNNISFEQLSIKKNAIGVPFLFLNNKKQSSTLSISHHGNYSGFAIK